MNVGAEDSKKELKLEFHRPFLLKLLLFELKIVNLLLKDSDLWF
ncbi:MAG: hypothetical protein RLZZ628_4337 [Bacteroidota bacterium]|jgi:hypothetical protein